MTLYVISMCNIQGYTNFKCQDARATKYFVVASNICGFSVWNLHLWVFGMELTFVGFRYVTYICVFSVWNLHLCVIGMELTFVGFRHGTYICGFSVCNLLLWVFGM